MFIPFLSFIVSIFVRNVSLIFIISLNRFLVFPILLFPSISLYCSLKKVFFSLLDIIWNSAYRWVYLSFIPLPFASLLFSAICKVSSDKHFAFLAFLFPGDGFDHHLLYNVLNLCRQLFRHSYQI